MKNIINKLIISIFISNLLICTSSFGNEINEIRKLKNELNELKSKIENEDKNKKIKFLENISYGAKLFYLKDNLGDPDRVIYYGNDEQRLIYNFSFNRNGKTVKSVSIFISYGRLTRLSYHFSYYKEKKLIDRNKLNNLTKCYLDQKDIIKNFGKPDYIKKASNKNLWFYHSLTCNMEDDMPIIIYFSNKNKLIGYSCNYSSSYKYDYNNSAKTCAEEENPKNSEIKKIEVKKQTISNNKNIISKNNIKTIKFINNDKKIYVNGKKIILSSNIKYGEILWNNEQALYANVFDIYKILNIPSNSIKINEKTKSFELNYSNIYFYISGTGDKNKLKIDNEGIDWIYFPNIEKINNKNYMDINRLLYLFNYYIPKDEKINNEIKWIHDDKKINSNDYIIDKVNLTKSKKSDIDKLYGQAGRIGIKIIDAFEEIFTCAYNDFIIVYSSLSESDESISEINEVELTSNKFKTYRGIKVGDTFEKMINEYGTNYQYDRPQVNIDIKTNLGKYIDKWGYEYKKDNIYQNMDYNIYTYHSISSYWFSKGIKFYVHDNIIKKIVIFKYITS